MIKKQRLLLFILIFAISVFYSCTPKELIISNDQLSDNVSISEIFGDNMVLQRDADVAVWGWGTPGKYVKIKLGESSKTVMVNEERKWETVIKTGPAGDHVDMYACAKDTVVISNIVYGDVWLLTGQSNMEMPLADWGRVLNYKDEIAEANYPDIHLFRSDNSKIQYSYTAEEHVRDLNGWETCSPKTVEEFSALGYFFGRKIYKETGVPIGLIQATSGGTPVEAWMPRNLCLEYDDIISWMGDVIDGDMANDKARERANKIEVEAWYDGAKKFDKGLNAVIKWYDNKLDDSQWTEINDVPEGFWFENGYEDVKGVFWYRKKVDLPVSFAGKEAFVRIGQIYERSEFYVNGTFIGIFTSNGQPTEYTIPQGVLKQGQNQLALRISANRTNGGMRGLPEDYFITVDDDTLSLSGAWRIAQSFDYNDYVKSPKKISLKRRPSIVYNALVNPLIPFTVKGVLWYQGESNMNNSKVYDDYIKAMINEYRGLWGVDFPFYFVQIANYLKNTPTDKLPWIREAQTAALELKNVYMASTIDIGNKHDVHPKNKQEIGNRLADLALKYTYGEKNIAADHPDILKAKVENDKIILTFKKTGKLGLKYGTTPVGFQIAEKDGNWVDADAVISGEKIILSNPNIKNPVFVRHAWHNFPDINVTDESGLPLLPFRTDQFERIEN